MQRFRGAMRRTLLLASTMTTWALAPKTVILVRHGAVNREAAGLTPEGLYGGDVDVPLSERGEAEARAAAAFVATEFGPRVTSVFASPMKRAMYGAERTVEALGTSLPVDAREALREVKRGAWVDKSLEQVAKEYPGEDMQRFLDDYDFHPAGGGESVNDVQMRAKKCLLEDVLPTIKEGECAVVVSHLFITRSLLSFAEPSTPVAQISVPTASVSTLEFVGDAVSINLRGLKPDLSAADDARLAPGSAET
jgi:probable phosphoglycerate mutase